MNLYDKIKSIYPELDDQEFLPQGSIVLQNDSDGKGPYIKKWEHSVYACPTEEQLSNA